jgi:hypothetical protein
VGDVVFGLDQISGAMGQATLAATTTRNDLSAVTEHRHRGRRPVSGERREPPEDLNEVVAQERLGDDD